MATRLPSQPTDARNRSTRLIPPVGLPVFALLWTLSCTPWPTTTQPPNIDPLFSALHAADYEHLGALLEERYELPADSPSWPIEMYLRAEAHRELGATANARAAFRQLVTWAVSDHPLGPYRDTWGGTGLSVVALWRWLEIAHEHGLARSDELDRLLEAANQLQETRFYSAMVRTRLLPALPLLEERIRYLLSQVAWDNGRPDEAKVLYLDFLAVNSDETLLAADNPIRSQLLSEGLVTSDRLDLYAALRQLAFSWPRDKKDAAARTLRRIYDNPLASSDLRAHAGYEWANYMRSRDRREAMTVLTAVSNLAADDTLLQRALYRRGVIARAADDRTSFRRDMTALLARFPAGPLADDALAQLASDALYQGNLPDALRHYTNLRTIASTAELQYFAHFYPALGLFSRGDTVSLENADRLLRDYLSTASRTDYRRRALFWRGRIAERRRDTPRAREIFRQLAAEVRYDYYGLRARLHLELGETASRDSVPARITEIHQDLRAAYAESARHIGPGPTLTTPYHRRLHEAIGTGLYGRALEGVRGLKLRLDDVSLTDLETNRLVPAAALLVSLRQDALAAKDRGLHANNWLPLMGSVSSTELQDWPLLVEMAFLHNDAERRRWYSLQEDVRYLATLYPSPERIPALARPLAASAWDIDGSPALSQALMYAVIRHESGFYTQAISPQGALGLFQFMPSTFRALTGEGGIVANIGGRSEVDYLFDPERNIGLWARWVAAEFPIRRRRSIMSSVMRHQAGSGNVLEWREYWRGAGALDDVEFQVETTQFAGTGNFLRRVLRDTAIVEAAGFLAN